MDTRDILYVVILLGFLFQSLFHLWKIINLKSRQTASQAWPATMGKVLDKRYSQLDRFKLFSYSAAMIVRFLTGFR